MLEKLDFIIINFNDIFASFDKDNYDEAFLIFQELHNYYINFDSNRKIWIKYLYDFKKFYEKKVLESNLSEKNKIILKEVFEKFYNNLKLEIISIPKEKIKFIVSEIKFNINQIFQLKN